MNSRTLAITIGVIIIAGLAYASYVTPGSPLYPGTSGSYSSVASSLSSTSRGTSVSSVASTAFSRSSVSSVSSRASSTSSAVTGTGSSSSFAQTSPRETVSQFYLQAASHNGDVIANVVANSPFLTAGFAASVSEYTDLFCNERQPLNFSTTLVSRTDSSAVVQVNERYITGNVAVTINAVNDNGAWRIDGVTCGAASSSSN